MRKSLTALTLVVALSFGELPAHTQENPNAHVLTHSTPAENSESAENPSSASGGSENSESADSSSSSNGSGETADSSNADSSGENSGSSTETFIGVAAVIAVIGGIAAGVHWAMLQGFIPNPFQPPAPAPAPAPAPTPAPAPAPAPRRAAPVQHAQYPNCAAVWNQLGRPIHSNEPGYHRGLDGDSDGVGCEKRPS